MNPSMLTGEDNLKESAFRSLSEREPKLSDAMSTTIRGVVDMTSCCCFCISFSSSPDKKKIQLKPECLFLVGEKEILTYRKKTIPCLVCM